MFATQKLLRRDQKQFEPLSQSDRILSHASGSSSVVERELPKLEVRVRFPSPAPIRVLCRLRMTSALNPL